MARFDDIVDRLDRLQPVWLVAINAMLALFVVLAHGILLLLVLLGKIPATQLDQDFKFVYFTIPIAFACLALAVVAVFLPTSRAWVLKVHATLLVLGAGLMLYFAIEIIVNGVPSKGQFSWNPVLFAFVLAYPIYLTRLAWLSGATRRHTAVRYAHVVALVLSVPISALVFWRVYAAA